MMVVVCESLQLLGIYHMKSMLEHCAVGIINAQMSNAMYAFMDAYSRGDQQICVLQADHVNSIHDMDRKIDQTRSVPFTR